MAKPTPFFSIGITTYNRRELLKHTLSSVTGQTFPDFEAIVGNDYVDEVLSAEVLGVDDARIRFVNYPKNLGEIQNMNALLEMSSGRYFTWLADDDLYSSNFLQAVYDALVQYELPPCVFTSYTMGDANCRIEKIPIGKSYAYSGPQFLRRYLSRLLTTQGCYGVFNLEYLRGIGGIEKLGNGFSPYSDHLLAIKTGLLKKVIYIDAPLILYRLHEGSISWTSKDVNSYVSAQEDLCRKSVSILGADGLRGDFYLNLYLLLKWCIGDFNSVFCRSGSANWRQVISYLSFIKGNMNFLKGTLFFWKTIGFLMKKMARLILDTGKNKLQGVSTGRG